MQAYNTTTNSVAALLTGEAPKYTDPESKFVYREVSQVALNELKGNLADGFRDLLAKQSNVKSPMNRRGKRGGPVLFGNVAQPGTEGMTIVGLFNPDFAQVAVYNTEDGLCMTEQGTDATKGHLYKLDERKVHDGKLVDEKVLQVVLKVGKEYSLGLLLSEAQLSTDGVGDLLPKVEKEEEVESDEENDNNDPLATEKTAHTATTQQLATEKEAHGTTKQLLKLANERYSFFSGFAACFVLAVVAYAIKEGHLRVPQGVRLWSTTV